MPVSLAVWSQILKPGDGVEFVPPADLKLANAALGTEISDEKSRSSLRLIYSGPSAGDSDDEDEEDEEDSDDERLAPVATVLCSLTPGKVEQAMLDLVLEGGQAVAFENTGKNTIYITGNFIDQIPHDDPPSDSELGLPGDESDQEVEGDELVGDEDVSMQEPEPELKQEVPPKAEKKRALEEEKGEKAEKKKAKKTKGNTGEAVPVDADQVSAPQNETEAPSAKKEKKSKKKDKVVAEEKLQPNEEKHEPDPKEAKGKGETRETTGGVQIRDTKPGKGAEATKGSTVRVRYVGRLEDGSVFDSNEKGKAFEFTLGAGDVIKGWDVGLLGMKEGGERSLVIPPAMGYGKRKQSGIPAGSTLVFDVKLVKVVS